MGPLFPKAAAARHAAINWIPLTNRRTIYIYHNNNNNNKHITHFANDLVEFNLSTCQQSIQDSLAARASTINQQKHYEIILVTLYKTAKVSLIQLLLLYLRQDAFISVIIIYIQLQLLN